MRQVSRCLQSDFVASLDSVTDKRPNKHEQYSQSYTQPSTDKQTNERTKNKPALQKHVRN